MTPQTANSIRTASALPVLHWLKARVLGGPQLGAFITALHTAVFFGFSYVGLTIVTGWAQQVMSMCGVADRQ